MVSAQLPPKAGVSNAAQVSCVWVLGWYFLGCLTACGLLAQLPLFTVSLLFFFIAMPASAREVNGSFDGRTVANPSGLVECIRCQDSRFRLGLDSLTVFEYLV